MVVTTIDTVAWMQPKSSVACYYTAKLDENMKQNLPYNKAISQEEECRFSRPGFEWKVEVLEGLCIFLV